MLKAAIVLMVAYATDHLADRFTVERIVDVREFNARLKDAVGKFSPRSIGENFSSRLRQEHGWRLLSLGAPFNLDAAREGLKKQYPSASARSGVLIDVTGDSRRQSAEYRQRLAAIDSGEFPGWVPRLVTKIVGLPDAFLFVVRELFAGGLLSAVIGGLTLAVLLTFVFTREPGALPGVLMLLPLFTTFIAWALFLPVWLSATTLDWLVVRLFGTAMTAPETTVIAGLVSFGPVNWAAKKLFEHHVTENYLKEVDAS